MNETRSPTMIDIARHSGVALSTVSYALSGKRPVSAATRARVQHAIEELGFKPHAVGRALASRVSGTIALFFPASRDSLQVENHIFLAGVAEATSKAGYGLLVSTTAHDPDGPASMLETGRADGALLMEVHLHDERVERLRSSGRIFTLIGHVEDNTGISFVDFDFDDAVRTAVAHLHDLGHRHIALLNRVPDPVDREYGPAERSRTGFEAAISDFSLVGDHLVSGSTAEHYLQLRRFLEQVPTCTAAITLSMTFAPLLRGLADLGRQVPRDFSIVAVIAPQLREIVNPPLTTVDLPAFDMGRLGAEALLGQLVDGPRSPTQVLLRGRLNTGSSGPPPVVSPRS